MAKKIINNFNGGELSPYLYGRGDFPKYNSGSIKCQNFIPISYGGVTKRPSTKFLNVTKNGNNARLIPFIVNNQNAYILEFTSGVIRIFKDDVLVLDSNGDILELTTPYTARDLSILDFVQSLDQMFLVHPDHPVKVLSREEVNVDSETWSFEDFTFTIPPTQDPNKTDVSLAIYPATSTPERYVRAYTDNTGTTFSNLFDQDALDEGQFYFFKQARENKTTSASSEAKDIYFNQNLFTVDLLGTLGFTTGGSAPTAGSYNGFTYDTSSNSTVSPWMNVSYTTFAMQVICAGVRVVIDKLVGTDPTLVSASWFEHHVVCDNRSHVSGTANKTFSYTELETQEANSFIRIRVIDMTPATTSAEDLLDKFCSFELQPTEDKVISAFTLKNSLPVSSATDETLSNSRQIDIVSHIQEDGDFISDGVRDLYISDQWTAGAFSFVLGYAVSIAFYENRLIFGGNFQFPNTLYISKTNDYSNFVIGNLDTDGMRLTLQSLTDNEIKWILPANQLIIGTSNSEWTLGSDSDNTPISPTAFALKERTQFGSNELKGKFVSDSILFTTNSSRKIREWNFNYFTLESETPDLTLLADHITESGLIELTYQKEPDNILWGITNDGVLLGLTYNKSQQIYAWHKHKIGNTDGFLYDGINKNRHILGINANQVTTPTAPTGNILHRSLNKDFEMEFTCNIDTVQRVPSYIYNNGSYGNDIRRNLHGNVLFTSNQYYTDKNNVSLWTGLPNDPDNPNGLELSVAGNIQTGVHFRRGGDFIYYNGTEVIEWSDSGWEIEWEMAYSSHTAIPGRGNDVDLDKYFNKAVGNGMPWRFASNGSDNSGNAGTVGCQLYFASNSPQHNGGRFQAQVGVGTTTNGGSSFFQAGDFPGSNSFGNANAGTRTKTVNTQTDNLFCYNKYKIVFTPTSGTFTKSMDNADNSAGNTVTCKTGKFEYYLNDYKVSEKEGENIGWVTAKTYYNALGTGAFTDNLFTQAVNPSPTNASPTNIDMTIDGNNNWYRESFLKSHFQGSLKSLKITSNGTVTHNLDFTNVGNDTTVGVNEVKNTGTATGTWKIATVTDIANIKDPSNGSNATFTTNGLPIGFREHRALKRNTGWTETDNVVSSTTNFIPYVFKFPQAFTENENVIKLSWMPTLGKVTLIRDSLVKTERTFDWSPDDRVRDTFYYGNVWSGYGQPKEDSEVGNRYIQTQVSSAGSTVETTLSYNKFVYSDLAFTSPSGNANGKNRLTYYDYDGVDGTLKTWKLFNYPYLCPNTGGNPYSGGTDTYLPQMDYSVSALEYDSQAIFDMNGNRGGTGTNKNKSAVIKYTTFEAGSVTRTYTDETGATITAGWETQGGGSGKNGERGFSQATSTWGGTVRSSINLNVPKRGTIFRSRTVGQTDNGSSQTRPFQEDADDKSWFRSYDIVENPLDNFPVPYEASAWNLTDLATSSNFNLIDTANNGYLNGKFWLGLATVTQTASQFGMTSYSRYPIIIFGIHYDRLKEIFLPTEYYLPCKSAVVLPVENRINEVYVTVEHEVENQIVHSICKLDNREWGTNFEQQYNGLDIYTRLPIGSTSTEINGFETYNNQDYELIVNGRRALARINNNKVKQITIYPNSPSAGKTQVVFSMESLSDIFIPGSFFGRRANLFKQCTIQNIFNESDDTNINVTIPKEKVSSSASVLASVGYLFVDFMNNTCTYTFETSGSSVYSIPTYRIPIEGVITSEQGFNSGDIVVVGKSYQSEIVPLYINDSQLAGEKVSVFNGKILFKDTISCEVGQTKDALEKVRFEYDNDPNKIKSDVAEFYIKNENEYLQTVTLLEKDNVPCTILSALLEIPE